MLQMAVASRTAAMSRLIVVAGVRSEGRAAAVTGLTCVGRRLAVWKSFVRKATVGWAGRV